MALGKPVVDDVASKAKGRFFSPVYSTASPKRSRISSHLLRDPRSRALLYSRWRIPFFAYARLAGQAEAELV
jgi:hypothetical protein